MADYQAALSVTLEMTAQLFRQPARDCNAVRTRLLLIGNQ